MEREWIAIGTLQVDTRMLDAMPLGRCRPEECRSICCGHGVYLDLAHAARIIEEAELIKPQLPPDRHQVSDWFDGNVGEDSDFPSGYRVGTQVIPDPQHPDGTRCVFLRPDNRCALQATSIALGRHPWDLKPFYCCLFPVIILGNRVEIDDDNPIYLTGGTCSRAEKVAAPFYQTYKEEMVLVLGEGGYAQLCAIAESRRKN